MKKLKSVIQYECMTSFKYIWIFYGIQYMIITLIITLIGLGTGTFENVGTNTLEMNSIIFVGILGVLGFKEDFKMLIQNGFTRKYIFIATFSLFAFISGIMALVDTITGNLLHYFSKDYSSLYGSIYGYDHIFANWIFLFLIYVLICSLFYLGVLVINKIGKAYSIILSVALCGLLLLIAVLFRYNINSNIVKNILEFALKSMGFMVNGTVNYFFPVLTLLLITALLGLGSYCIIRRTELT